jgi:uncharacterized membrane protein YeaQ/YmgE (transglycosylase-associated protein family)
MEFIWMLIIGLIAGAIAKLIMPGKDPGGIIVTMLIGVAGAFVGGFLFQALGIGGGGPAGLIGAIIGALILLAIYRLVMGRRADGPGPGV